MANSPSDADRTQSTLWPDRADMVSQQSAANQVFRQNSERLQQASEAKRDAQLSEQSHAGSDELTFVKGSGRGNYGVLKKEHFDAIQKHNAAQEQELGQSTGEQELSFPKEASRRNYGVLKQEDVDRITGNDQTPEQGAGEDELTFVKDSGRENDADVKQEPAGATENELTFVKDQGTELSQGR